LIYAYNPSGAWTHRHQMTLAGKRTDFTLSDLLDAAVSADLKPAKAKEMIHQVHAAVSRWPEFAEAAAIPAPWITEIQNNLRLSLVVTS